MPVQTTLPFILNEHTSRVIAWQFQDADATGVNNNALLSVTLTLYDLETDAIINSRNAQDVLGGSHTGQNNVTIDTSGNAIWYMQPEDNDIIGTSIPEGGYETHIALFVWTWDPGDGEGVRENNMEVSLLVKNLHRIP